MTWIQIPESLEFPLGERPVYLVRKSFTLEQVPPSATLRASAQGIYTAYVNGNRVGDWELTPGYTQYEKRIQFQEFEVSEFLVQGENAITFELADGWFRGSVSIFQVGNQFGESVGLWAELDLVDQLLESDESWVFTTSHILAADLMRGQREDRRLIDQRNYLPGSEVNWHRVKPIAVDAALIPQQCEPNRVVERVSPVSITQLSDGTQLIDFGQNLNGWVRLDYLGLKNSEVSIKHGEALGLDGRVTLENVAVRFPDFPAIDLNQIDHVISAGMPGDYFEPRYVSHGFQYVEVSGLDRPLTNSEISAAFVHVDFEPLLELECSDPRIAWIHDASVRSFRGNALDVPTDCPTRERSPWTGDWQIFVDTAARQFNVQKFNSKFLADVRLNQGEDGKVMNINPLEPNGRIGFPGMTNGSSGWGDVIVQAPWVMYQEYGAVQELEMNFEAMTKWVDFAVNQAASGRHESRSNLPMGEYEQFLWDTGFHWGEWMEPEQGTPSSHHDLFSSDKAVVATAYLYRSAKQVAEISEILGKGVGVSSKYRTIANGALLAWREACLNQDGTLVIETQGNYVRALAFGLIPIELQGAAAGRLAELIRANDYRLGTGFLSTGLLLPVLVEHGYEDVAVKVFFQEAEPSWLNMRKKGATTYWEQWNGIDDSAVAHDSLNHYSKGAVAGFIYRNLLGLRATTPGFGTYEVRPVLHPALGHLKLTQRTAQGEIEIQIFNNSESANIRIDASRMRANGVFSAFGANESEIKPGSVFEVTLPISS